MLSKNSQPGKRNKSQDLAMPQLPELEKYDTNKLLEQFKKYLFKEKKQSSKNLNVNDAYKKLLCDLKKRNQQKKDNLSKLDNKLKSFNPTQILTSKLFNEIYPQSKESKQQNFQEFKTEQNYPLAQLKVDYSIIQCKYKAIRPMTSKSNFRINGKYSRQMSSQFSRSRLAQQTIGVLSQIKNVVKTREDEVQSQAIRNSNQRSLHEILQSILMIQSQEKKLQQQISGLRQSLDRIKKSLISVNKQLLIENRNQEKYKHISYLATSIKNQTDYIKIQNSKGFNSMASRQEDTIFQLKILKSTLKKQKDDMETLYIEDINQWVKIHKNQNPQNKKQLLFSPQKTFQKKFVQKIDKSSSEKTELQKSIDNSLRPAIAQSNSKEMIKVIDQLDTIIQLLKRKELCFEAIKQRECTRVRLGKIKKQLLQKQRVEILERAEQFENKYQMKICSIQNLILSVYYSLLDKNMAIESECMKLTQTKQQLDTDLKEIAEKYQKDIQAYQQTYRIFAEEKNSYLKLNSIIKKNSTVFLKIILVFQSMLFKFRYMFSLALLLDIDKKSFKDCVAQIDSCFYSGMFFKFNYQNQAMTSGQRHDIINQKQFQDIFVEKKIDQETACQLSQLMFNDHRSNLILHKSWIENRVKDLRFRQILQSDVFDIIQSIRADCDQIYVMRLPSYASLFLTCFKSISMSKYQSKLASSSNQRGSIFLPTGLKKKQYPTQMIDEGNQSQEKQSDISPYEISKKKIVFTAENTNTRDENILGQDPRKVIYYLQEINNKNQMKFKALNFFCEGKAYKYNPQIVIPDYPMIRREDY